MKKPTPAPRKKAAKKAKQLVTVRENALNVIRAEMRGMFHAVQDHSRRIDSLESSIASLTPKSDAAKPGDKPERWYQVGTIVYRLPKGSNAEERWMEGAMDRLSFNPWNREKLDDQIARGNAVELPGNPFISEKTAQKCPHCGMMKKPPAL